MKPKTYSVRTVVVALCDHDYSSVYWNMMESIKILVEYLNGSNDIEWRIRQFVERSAEAFYVSCQLRRKEDFSEDDLKNTLKYLSSVRVMFNEEAEEFMMNHDHDGGSWYLTMDDGNISSF